LALFLVFQAVLLHNVAAREVAPFLPRNFDQGFYLDDSYRIFESIRLHGFVSGIIAALQTPRAQGLLVPMEAAATFVILGPGRLSAVDLNIAYFVVAAAVSAELARRTFGIRVGMITLGLIAAIYGTTSLAGGLFDFRLDFIGFCLWGVLLATIVFAGNSDRLLWLVITLLSMALVLSRLISVAVVLPILLWRGVYDCAFELGHGRRLARSTRCLMPAIVVSALVTLFVIAEWQPIFNYYIVGHVTGTENALRASDAGVFNELDSITYYAKSLILSQLGIPALVLVFAVLSATSIIVLTDRTTGVGRLSARKMRLISLLSVSWLATYTILTLDQAKSPVVGNLLLPPVLIAVVGAAGVAEHIVQEKSPRAWQRRLFSTVAVIVLGGGVLIGLNTVSRTERVRGPATAVDLGRAGQLLLDVGDYLNATGLQNAVWSVDGHQEFATSTTVETFYYEQRGILLNLRGGLGDEGIADHVSPEEVLAKGRASDVLLLGDTSAAGPALPYPSDVDIWGQESRLHELAQSTLVPLGRYWTYGRLWDAYVRPSFGLAGVDSGWITAAGLDVTLWPQVAAWGSCISIEGDSPIEWLPSIPNTNVSVDAAPALLVPSRLQVDHDHYRLLIAITDQLRALTGSTRLHVDFSTYFVPSSIGLNSDTRHLVISAPTSRSVLRDTCPVP
jgi:hypothetical protein